MISRVILPMLLIISSCIILKAQKIPVTTINGHECVQGELIVKFNKSPLKAANRKIQIRRKTFMERYSAVEEKKYRIGAELWKLDTLKNDYDLTSFIDSLKAQPDVEYAEPNYIIYADEVTPNDPKFPEQWALNNTGQSGGTPNADINAPDAWEVTTGDSSLVVGILDSGIDYNHEDLTDNIWINDDEIPDNGIDDDNNGYIDDVHGWDFFNNDNNPMDDNGHGTHIAGIIGARGNNGIGVSGIAWKCQLAGLKILGNDGTGVLSAAIAAIEYAVQNEIKISNNSWGNMWSSSALKDVLNYANNFEHIFVASAGNYSYNTDVQPYYPAGYEIPNIVSVGSANDYFTLSEYSNYGKSSVDIIAPGDKILSTFLNNQYQLLTGTSMAAPHIAGAIVLLYSEYPSLSKNEIISKLYDGCKQERDLLEKVKYGRLDLTLLFKKKYVDIKIWQAGDFRFVKTGDISKSITMDIYTIDDPLLSIDSIKSTDGFLFKLEGEEEFTNTLINPALTPNFQNHLHVIFSPQTIGLNEGLIEIFYHVGSVIDSAKIYCKGYGVNKGTIIDDMNISGVWTKTNSPYYINRSFEIGTNAFVSLPEGIGNSLTIEPGTEIFFSNNTGIMVWDSGIFKAKGTLNDSIYFTTLHNDKWAGIQFSNSGYNDTISYSNISNVGGRGGAIKSFVDYSIKAEICITNCKIINNNIHAYSYYSSGGIFLERTGGYIANNLIANNHIKGHSYGGGGVTLIKSDVLLYNNIIVNNQYNNLGTAGLMRVGGGGIISFGGNPRIISNTVCNNLAADIEPYTSFGQSFYTLGGGILFMSTPSNLIRGFNNIFYFNDSFEHDQIGLFESDSSKVDLNFNCIQNEFYNEYNYNLEPQFIDSPQGAGTLFDGVNSNWQLKESSPLLDNGLGKSEIGAYGQFPAFLVTDKDSISIKSLPFSSSDTFFVNLELINYSNVFELVIDSIKSNYLIVDNVDIFPLIINPLDTFQLIIGLTLNYSGIVDDTINIFSNSVFEREVIPYKGEITPVEDDGSILYGEINGTLKKDKEPYYVIQDILVKENRDLFIEEGCRLYFMNNSKMTIEGELISLGIPNDSIFYCSYPKDSSWGGIEILYGKAEFEYSHFEKAKTLGDENNYGGAIYASCDTLIIKDCLFKDNVAEFGGAVYFKGGHFGPYLLYVENSLFKNNLTNNNIYASGSSVFAISNSGADGNIFINSCQFFKNEDEYRGTLNFEFTDDEVKVRNSIFHDNYCAIGFYYSDLDLINCTISDNQRGIVGVGTEIDITNTILTGNQEDYHGSSNNIIFNYSCISNQIPTEFIGDGCIISDVVSLDSDLSLLPNSECIDSGINDSIDFYNDIQGKIRIWDGDSDGISMVDMGAYEYNSPCYLIEENISICEGETYQFGTQFLTTSGEYTETFQSLSGCDSIVALTLTVKNCSVPTNQQVVSTTLITGTIDCFNATNTITVAGDGTNVIVESGASAEFIAGQSIRFLPGFHAQEGSYVHGHITTTGTYCVEEAPAIVAAETTNEKEAVIVDAELTGRAEREMVVYPNPNSGEFTVEFRNFEDEIRVMLFNSIGQLMQDELTTDREIRMHVPNLKSGMYFIKAVNKGEQFNRKIVVR